LRIEPPGMPALALTLAHFLRAPIAHRTPAIKFLDAGHARS
jgi:hypothetical protein